MNFNEVNNKLTKSKQGGASLDKRQTSSKENFKAWNVRYTIVFGIFALVIVTIAVSFAFFTYSRVGETTTTITSGDIEFTYKEGESASLANAFPVSDSVGAQDTTKEYTFTVNLSSSSANNKMNYNVYLLDANDDENNNYFTNEQIKFSLIKDNVFVAGTSADTGRKLSSITGFTAGATIGEGLVLESQEITSGKTDEYKLRIWISDDVDYSNTELTDDNTDVDNDANLSSGKYNGYKYSLKVKVTSEMVVVKPVDVEITFNANGGNVSQTTKTVEHDGTYGELPTPTRENYRFLGWYTEKDGGSQITSTSKVEVQSSQTLYAKWELVVYTDNSGANVPEISTGMIPVTYNGTNWVKADVSKEWYNYDEQWWANAVTVSSSKRSTYMNAAAGTTISMDDINTMWVWIPRYEYGTITSTTATEIKVKFLSGTASNVTSNYNTHQAFTFGSNSLTGIWVAKFEASSNTSCTPTDDAVNTGCDLASLKVNVKPNVASWRGIRVSTIDLNSRAMNDSGNIYGFLETEIDTHAMKNLEWGVVAYLSQSKYGKYGNSSYTGANKEIYQNKSSSYITGMSNGTPGTTTTNTQVTYDVEGKGTGASTTGNIYGIYDMSGGAWESVMGVIKDNSSDKPMSGSSNVYNSGFSGKLYNSGNYINFTGRSFPINEYYDLYEFGTTIDDSEAYARYKAGDATKETRGWYGDFSEFIGSEYPWFGRGGVYNDGETLAGIFHSFSNWGTATTNGSFRPVLIQK